MKTLNIQPADPQESNEKATFTLRNLDLFKKTNKPNPTFTKIAVKSNNPLTINL